MFMWFLIFPDPVFCLLRISSNIFRKVSETLVGSVKSIQTHIFPCFSLYLLLKFRVASKADSLKLTAGFLICCTCHFQGQLALLCFSHAPAWFFGLFLLASLSPVSDLCSVIRGQKWPLIQLTSSVVLRRGRDTANAAGMCGECLLWVDSMGNRHSLKQACSS